MKSEDTYDPLRCVTCGHRIEAHHAGIYGKDNCVALGYKKPWGVNCSCIGFAVLRPRRV